MIDCNTIKDTKPAPDRSAMGRPTPPPVDLEMFKACMETREEYRPCLIGKR